MPFTISFLVMVSAGEGMTFYKKRSQTNCYANDKMKLNGNLYTLAFIAIGEWFYLRAVAQIQDNRLS